MKWLRAVHLASVGTFGGTLVTRLVCGATVGPVSPTCFGAVRQVVAATALSVWRPRLGGRPVAGRSTRPAARQAAR